MDARPLAGLKVIEIAAIGPVPWATALLAQQGASVVRIDRPEALLNEQDAIARGRRAVVLDLKSEDGQRRLEALVRMADVLVEGMRPGVMERLGLGPRECLAINPRLVYARMTGWGQDGPLSNRAGHDINYIATTGVLHAIGAERPTVPLNLVGDYGGGGMFLLFGLLAKVIAVRGGGAGGVVDVAMVDGAANLMAMQYNRLATGRWKDARASNALDGGVPWYSVYETADGKHVAVGALEPQFYAALLRVLDLEGRVPPREDAGRHGELRQIFTDVFKTRSRDEWATLFEPTDACVSPVLGMEEAKGYPHHRHRGVFQHAHGQHMPAPAPLFGPERAAPLTPTERWSIDDALAAWSSPASLTGD